MGESVSFKAYLKRDGQDVEVRRFGIDNGAASNFIYLRSKIQAMFPSIQDDQFTVYWQDNDKDYIAIGSDEELLEAFTSGISQPFKLFVNITTQQQPEQEPSGQSEIHPGITCDSCEQAVAGFRYKCVTCPDFDLCASCEGSGRHPQHFMLRMPFPMGSASCHPKFFRKFFGRPHKFHKFGRHHTQAAGFSGGRCPFTRQQGSATPAPGEANIFDFSSLLEFINSMTGAAAGQADEPAANAQTSANSQASPGQQAGSQASPGQQAGSQEARPPRHNTGAEYLNGIGQAITAFLDPFGVDVTFDVRPQSASRNGQTPAPQQTATTTETSAPTNTSVLTPSQQDVSSSSQRNVPSPTLTPRESSPVTENRTVLVQDTTPLVARRNSDGWTVIGRESPIRSEVAMDVDESRAAKPSSVEAVKVVPTPTAPPAAPQPPTALSDSKGLRMQEAINNIRSMGFNYETQILQELLRRENCDISSVLDTILNNSGNK